MKLPKINGDQILLAGSTLCNRKRASINLSNQIVLMSCFPGLPTEVAFRIIDNADSGTLINLSRTSEECRELVDDYVDRLNRKGCLVEEISVLAGFPTLLEDWDFGILKKVCKLT